MAAMRFEQVQRFNLAKTIFWGSGHFRIFWGGEEPCNTRLGVLQENISAFSVTVLKNESCY